MSEKTTPDPMAPPLPAVDPFVLRAENCGELLYISESSLKNAQDVVVSMWDRLFGAAERITQMLVDADVSKQARANAPDQIKAIVDDEKEPTPGPNVVVDHFDGDTNGNPKDDGGNDIF